MDTGSERAETVGRRRTWTRPRSPFTLPNGDGATGRVTQGVAPAVTEPDPRGLRSATGPPHATTVREQCGLDPGETIRKFLAEWRGAARYRSRVPSPGVRSLAVTSVTLWLAYGVWYAYSVFLVALLREFGWSRSLVSGAFSVFVIVHGLLAPALGWLADRIGPRRLVVAGGAVLAVGLALDGTITEAWHFYLSFGVLTAVGVAAAGWVPAVVLVQRWFTERVGVALGIVSAGIGVGMFVMVPLTQYLVDAVGWRWAFRAIGALVAVWIVPASLWLLRDPPPASGAARPMPDHAVTVGAALSSGRLWLLLATQVLGSFVAQMLLVHQVAYLVDRGIPALMAASVASVVGLASVGGKVGGGWLSDRAGRELTYTLGMACVALGIGALGLVAVTPGPLPAYAYGVLVGIGYTANATLMPAVVSDLFRGRHFGVIFGIVQVGNSLGGAAGPWVAGRVFDTTGSYRGALLMGLAAAAAATAALWIAAPRRARPGVRNIAP